MILYCTSLYLNLVVEYYGVSRHYADLPQYGRSKLVFEEDLSGLNVTIAETTRPFTFYLRCEKL